MKIKVLLAVMAVTSAAALVTAVGAGASAGPASSGHPAAVARWRIVKTVHGANMPQFLSMAATSTRSAWAFAQTSASPAGR